MKIYMQKFHYSDRFESMSLNPKHFQKVEIECTKLKLN